MVAASPSVVDRAPGLWVYEHLVALGIDGEALEFAAPLLGSPSDDASAVERSARLRASSTIALARAGSIARGASPRRRVVGAL